MDLKRNTISQSKFPTSRMSPALQHTPVQGASSNQISDTKMYQYQEQKIQISNLTHPKRERNLRSQTPHGKIQNKC